jgi:hypothetical protein
MMIEDSLINDTVMSLINLYESPENRGNLKLNRSFIKKVLNVVENNGYEIIPAANFPTEDFSATSIDSFEKSIKSWIQIENTTFEPDDVYMPTEQIMRDLITQGWIIKPPKGM